MIRLVIGDLPGPPPLLVVAAGAALSARGAGQPVTVERHRADDHRALDNILPDIRDAEQDKAIAQDGDHQRADQRAPDAADAADEARSAQDDRGDGVKLVGLAKLQARWRRRAAPPA